MGWRIRILKFRLDPLPWIVITDIYFTQCISWVTERHHFTAPGNSGMRWYRCSFTQQCIIRNTFAVLTKSNITEITDINIFISDAWIDHTVKSDKGIWHNDWVLDYSLLIDIYSRGQDRIFHGAFNYASRTDNTVAHVTVSKLFNRFIWSTCKYRPVARKAKRRFGAG